MSQEQRDEKAYGLSTTRSLLGLGTALFRTQQEDVAVVSRWSRINSVRLAWPSVRAVVLVPAIWRPDP
jgi:hypothetical protein